MNHAVPGLVVGLSLIAVGCSKDPEPAAKPKAEAPAAAPAPQPVEAKPVEAKPVEAKPVVALDCERIVPAALRAKFFGGWTFRAPVADAAPSSVASCVFANDKQKLDVLTVELRCEPHVVEASRIESTTRNFVNNGGAAIAGIGRAAVEYDLILVAWDDDTDCQLTLTTPGHEPDRKALARDVLAAVTPASLQAP